MFSFFKKSFSLNSQHRLILLLLILFLAAFLRFYNLSSIPNGLQQDETSLGYNAYSILHTGKDEYGKRMPLLFKAFGEYKLPGYIYLSTVPIAFFGANEFAVRFTSAFLGTLSILFLYLFVRELSEKKDDKLAFVSAMLLAINPWHIHFSRGAFEVTPALFFILAGSYLFFLGKNRKQIYLLILGVFILSFSMYTYNIARLFTPLLLLCYCFFYRIDRIFHITKEKVTFYISLVVIFGFFFLHVTADGGYSSTKGTLLFTSAPVQSQFIELRSYLSVLPSFFTKVFFNTYALTLLQYLQNVLSYFSVSFLFLTGSPHGNHGIGNVGQMYFIEAFFVVVGLSVLLKSRWEKLRIVVFWGLLSIGVAAMTREAPYATRGIFLVVPLVIFSALGLITALRVLLHLKKSIVKYLLITGIGCFFAFNIVYYLTSYYYRFPIAYAPMWKSQDKELSEFIKMHENEYDVIVVDSHSGLVYTSLLYYLPYDPRNFQETVSRYPDDSEGFSKVQSFGKYVFKDIDWTKDASRPRTLLITAKDQDPGNLPVVAAFSYPQRPVVLAVGQKIMQFPVTDVAYVALETK